MRLNKILDLSKNPTTNAELLTRYVFGNQTPTEFVPGKYYEQGEYVYERGPDGSLNVYMVTQSGTYDRIDTTHFTKATIPSMVQHVLGGSNIGEMVDNAACVAGGGSDGVNNIFGFNTYTNDDIKVEGNTFEIPEGDYVDTELYIDGKYVSKSLGEYTVDGTVVTVAGVIPEGVEIMLIAKTANHHNARLIKHYDVHPVRFNVGNTSIGDEYFTDKGIVAYAHKGIYKKHMVFDLYYKGKYIPTINYRYTFDRHTGKLVIDLDKTYAMVNYITPETLDDVIVAFTYSVSIQFKVSKHEHKEVAPAGRKLFQFDLRGEIEYISDDLRVYNNFVVVPPDEIIVDNYYVAITNSKHHIQSMSTATLTYKKYEIVDVNIEGENIHTSVQKNNETMYITAADASKEIVVPFINWDDSCFDILLFRENGLFIDNTKYYVKDGYAVFYDHDDTAIAESMLNFVLLDTTDGFKQYYKQVTITEEHLTNGLDIAIPYDYTIPMLVFKGEESYITRNKYVVEDNKIKFVAGTDIAVGEIVTMVFLEYVTPVIDAVAKMFSLKTQRKNGLELPLVTYNPNKDSLIMLKEDGAYLGIHNYKVVNNQSVIIMDGLVEINTPVDILVVRNLDAPVYRDSVPTLLELF